MERTDQTELFCRVCDKWVPAEVMTLMNEGKLQTRVKHNHEHDIDNFELTGSYSTKRF